ncbi:SAP domain-containing ribonucleoprotein isoform X2 [Bombina bombina]|uniref:SAP domain-containing ribonucleoprotein isoform X2 n=1 Tax=Bombina bombina TaxID=8345 RepID=UPI00235ADD27|nr:SAP domain-containing ribonucleoprotein isoform X2 [Bombina bombina]
MADVVDIHKLKLAELKQECLSHGLDAKGNKQDLINRLQTYLDEHAEEEANEEDVLGEETEEEDQKVVQIPVKEDVPPEENPSETESEKKLVKITSEVSVTDRLQKRAERFNVPTSLDSKKAARAARFGITSADPKGQSSDPKSTTEDDEKLKKRKERFGIVTNSASVTDDIEAKKRKRSERFGIV